MKVIIIGAGIAGLSAATLLKLNNQNCEIEIYEKENFIGGQAASALYNQCYTEYSWRIFGKTYHNIHYIINLLNIHNNFESLTNTCFIEGENSPSANFSHFNQISNIFRNEKNKINLIKYFALLLQSKDRLLNEYQDTNALEYFNNNEVIKSIMGPFLGMEANKVSISGVFKNLFSVVDTTVYPFTPKDTLLSVKPTNQALFDPWVKYLTNNGVKFYLNSELQNINKNLNSNSISSIIINNKHIHADEYIFACSLKPLNKIIQSNNNSLNLIKTLDNLKYLENGLQLYFTINIYFSELFDNTSLCKEMVIIDMPWQPIIQKKRGWSSEIKSHCNSLIKDIWNVGFLDNNKGLYHKKILSECTLKEAIEEGLYQIKNSKYIKKLEKNINKTFDEIFISTEHWNQFINDPLTGKLISTNPKFSINTGIMKYIPKSSQPNDIPINMYLAGYYVNNTMGGVSMEASCETGLNAADKILNKYAIKNNTQLPIKHNVKYLSWFTMPFNIVDSFLYKFCISFLQLLIFIISIIIIVVVFKVGPRRDSNPQPFA